MYDSSLFERFLYEAPGDDPPPDMGGDVQTEPVNDTPPDMNMDTNMSGSEDDMGGPPDIADSGDDMFMGGDDGAPPDMGDQEFGDENSEAEQDPNKNMEIDEKLSAIMNANLYQEALELLDNVTNQIAALKNNGDVLYSLSPEVPDIVVSLKKLEENMHAYLNNYFATEKYEKNLLFFNKCLNLFKVLNGIFDKNIRKGLKTSE